MPLELRIGSKVLRSNRWTLKYERDVKSEHIYNCPLGVRRYDHVFQPKFKFHKVVSLGQKPNMNLKKRINIQLEKTLLYKRTAYYLRNIRGLP